MCEYCHRTSNCLWACPNAPEVDPPICPICDLECELVYTCDNTGKLRGCNNCINVRDAWEELVYR